MTRHYTALGLLITVAWLGLAITYAGLKSAEFLNLAPNELGDFFAGVLSPLAFLWLVLGYLQQGQELKLSTEALRLQADELRNAVEQQRDLVQATREQVALEKEHNERTLRERTLAATPRFEVTAGGSVPSHGPDRSWRRFFVRISNEGAPVTAVRVFARGWNLAGQQVASFPILDRGSSERIEIEMPIQAFAEEVELTFTYVDALGQDGSVELVKTAVAGATTRVSGIEG